MARLAATAPRWVAGLLVVLIGAQVAAALTASDPALPALQTTPGTAPVTNVVDVPSILRANVFGESRPNADGSNAPATSLAMVLTGIIATNDPGSGYAFIGPSSTAVKLYVVGGTVSGARLHAVYPDRVLLDRGGTLESLMLVKRAGGGTAPAPLPVPPSGGAERVQQLVRDNPGIIGEIMRPQAVLADGRQRGYRVYPGPNLQAFNRLGLRPGDLVTAINGTTLDDPARGGEIFGTLGSVAEARVTIVRNGSQQELLLNLAEVANEAERISQSPAAVPVPAPNPETGQAAGPAAVR